MAYKTKYIHLTVQLHGGSRIREERWPSSIGSLFLVSDSWILTVTSYDGIEWDPRPLACRYSCHLWGLVLSFNSYTITLGGDNPFDMWCLGESNTVTMINRYVYYIKLRLGWTCHLLEGSFYKTVWFQWSASILHFKQWVHQNSPLRHCSSQLSVAAIKTMPRKQLWKESDDLP